MKAYEQYWTFSSIRGALTMVVAAGMLLIPNLAVAIVKIPFTLALAVNMLAVYMLLDAGAIFLLATQMPAQAKHRKAQYAHAAVSVLFGASLYLLLADVIGPQFLFLLVAFQAITMSAIEATVARDTHAQYGCLSCYSTAIALAACAVLLPFATGLDAFGQALALAGYVALYGASQLMLGARMLFVEYRTDHPAVTMSEAWRLAMDAPDATQCLDCEDCPADAVCKDHTLQGQLHLVMAARQPAIVRSIRVASLLQPSGVYRKALRER